MARHEPPVDLGNGVHALLGAVNSLIVEGQGGTALLVDSGQDADAGRRIRRALEQLELRPSAILNTHSHADHFGGNAYLLRQFPDLEVYAPEIEAEIIRAPYLEPVYLFHGASPLAELRSKWLLGPAAPVHHEVAAGESTLHGVSLRLLDVRGHAHRQLAVQLGDLLFAADAVFGAATLERYPLPFAQDVGAQLASFEVVAAATADGVRRLLPGHGELTDDIEGLVARNRAAVRRAAEVVLAACDGVGLEEVLARTAVELDLTMTDLARYHLNLCTVAAYLSHLREEGRVEPVLAGGRLTWKENA